MRKWISFYSICLIIIYEKPRSRWASEEMKKNIIQLKGKSTYLPVRRNPTTSAPLLLLLSLSINEVSLDSEDVNVIGRMRRKVNINDFESWIKVEDENKNKSRFIFSAVWCWWTKLTKEQLALFFTEFRVLKFVVLKRKVIINLEKHSHVTVQWLITG